ncbi:MAG TPA: glycosyltransferase [Caulobacterales bacterium]|nr:glycosyltransferase [Caulobacterales bacterium]
MYALQVAVVKSGGGITTAVQHYARMFARVGVRNAVLFRGPGAEMLRGEGFEVFEAPQHLTASWAAPVLPFGALRKAVGEPDIVIVHSDLALAGIVRAFPNARVVAPCHSDKTKHKHRAHLVVTLNPDQHARVSAALAGTRARTALLGNPYAPAQAAGPLRQAGAPRVNFVGRFIATKDPLALVAAVALTRKRPPLCFIGDGELSGAVREAVSAAGLGADFKGWVAGPFSAFAHNDVLVLPSHWEGLPYLLLESLDHGVPTIASDIPGNRAALGDGLFGALYPLGDAPALANAIDEALGNLDALRSKAEKGRAAIAARYGAAPFWAALQGALDLSA